MHHEQHAPQPDPSHDLLQQIDAGLHEQLRRATAIDPRLRRFRRALLDLGLPLPTDWGTVPSTDGAPDPTVVEFDAIPWATFDRLVCLLEDIAEGRPVEVTVVQGGPTLFDSGPAPAPLPERAPSTAHIQVPA